MEAPEKIYIPRLEGNETFVHVWCETKYRDYYNAENVEYIRTDALIAKAFEFFGEHLWEYIDVRNANCDTLINIDGDKLTGDFENYIKGE